MHSEANEASSRASAEKFSEGGKWKKTEKSQKRPKNSTIKPFSKRGGGGQQKKDQNWQKKTENSTIKPLSTISVKM